MTQQTNNALEVDILTWLLSAAGWAGGNTSIRLFQNDFVTGKTPAQLKAAVNADFTEATFAGYAALTLTAASWVIAGGLPTAATYAQQTFERSSTGAAQTIRGYWIRRVSDSRLLTFHQFPGPLSVEFLGARIRVIPRIELQDFDDA